MKCDCDECLEPGSSTPEKHNSPMWTIYGEEDQNIDRADRCLEALKSYKLGDIFVKQELVENYDDIKDTPSYRFKTCLNSFGLPYKYRVEYVSDRGCPVLYRLTSKGKIYKGSPIFPHEYYCLTDLEDYEWETHLNYPDEKYVPDPEYLDSIMLDQKFDPTAGQSEKEKLLKEIQKYNKSISIFTSPYYQKQQDDMKRFFKGLKNGEKFWNSLDNGYIFYSFKKIKTKWTVHCLDKNAKEQNLTLQDLRYKRIYSAQPRSFAKESAA